jgi:glyoxylase-like metal-dependent hydrolase (beta-lactamase superfamily II)
MGIPGAIASYLIPHRNGAVLVESGPGSTIGGLQAALSAYGLTVRDITDVFLTHIHLDHAGAAGWMARQGATIHVHPNGAPHLLDPEKLLSSAARIYGDAMQSLWGEFLPVPTERLSVINDGEVVEIDGISLQAIDTPGHADHHNVYLFNDVCISGDVGGVRVGGLRYLRLPMPPPELNLEKWRASLERLKRLSFRRIAPTHFGVYDDPGWHLSAIENELDQTEAWIEATMPASPPLDELTAQHEAWTRHRIEQSGLDSQEVQTIELVNPTWMSAQGIQRYWRKYRVAP